MSEQQLIGGTCGQRKELKVLESLVKAIANGQNVTYCTSLKRSSDRMRKMLEPLNKLIPIAKETKYEIQYSNGSTIKFMVSEEGHKDGKLKGFMADFIDLDMQGIE